MQPISEISVTHFDAYKNDFGCLFEIHGMQYQKHTIFYKVGMPYREGDQILFISIVFHQLPEFLDLFLPIAKTHRLNFEVAMNCQVAQSILDGEYGLENVGKVITIFFQSQAQLIKTIPHLLPCTLNYKGPHIHNKFHLGNRLYSNENIPGYNMQYINYENVQIPTRYKDITIFSKNPKGFTLKARIHSSRTKYVFIKTGFHEMWYDSSLVRNIKDRLLWQKEVLLELKSKVNLPILVEYFEKNNNSYLVTEEITGTSLAEFINSYGQNFATWSDMDTSAKSNILDTLQKIVQEIEKLHSAGYIHRDISIENILITDKNEIVLLDPEGFVNIRNSTPSPPYEISTTGFSAPELNTNRESVQCDIYSIGAIILSSTTRLLPNCFQPHDYSNLFGKVYTILKSEPLSNLIVTCMNPNPVLRKKIGEILCELNDQNGIKTNPKVQNSTTIHTNQGYDLENTIQSSLRHIEIETIGTDGNIVPLNLLRSFNNEANWNGFFTGHLGSAFTIIRALKLGYDNIKCTAKLKELVLMTIQRHMTRLLDCNLGLPSGILGLIPVILESVDAKLITLNNELEIFISNILNAANNSDIDDRALSDLISLTHYIHRNNAEIKESKWFNKWIDELEDKMKNKIVSINNQVTETYSPFSYYKSVFFLCNMRQSATLSNEYNKLQKNLSEILSRAKREIIDGKLNTKTDQTRITFNKTFKILLISGLSKNPYFIMEALSIIRLIPQSIIHNDFGLENGLTWMGYLYNTIRLELKDSNFEKRTANIAILFELFKIKSYEQSVCWVKDKYQMNGNNIISGNSGILNFLIDYDKDVIYPTELLP